MWLGRHRPCTREAFRPTSLGLGLLVLDSGMMWLHQGNGDRLSSDVGVQASEAPVRRLGRLLLIDVAARLVAAFGLLGSMANLFVDDTLLPPRALLVAVLGGTALMLVTETQVFKLRSRLGLRVRGRRLWAVTSSEERAALRDAGLQRLELAHRSGTYASWAAAGAAVTLGLIGSLSL
jgi:hypothetical protein